MTVDVPNPNPIDDWHDFVHAIMSQIDIISLVFIVVLVYLAWVLRGWQKDNVNRKDFDLADVIMENGRVSRRAMFEWGAFLSTTFVLLHQEYKNVVTDWYVYGYLAAWVSYGLARILKGDGPRFGPKEGGDAQS